MISIDAIHPATQYALDCIERKRVVGNSERLSCLRHLYDLARAGQLNDSLTLRVAVATGQDAPKPDPNFPWMFVASLAGYPGLKRSRARMDAWWESGALEKHSLQKGGRTLRPRGGPRSVCIL